MKKIITIALLVSILFNIVLIAPVTANAADETIKTVLVEDYGEIYEGEDASYDFYLADAGDVVLSFIGDSWEDKFDYSYTYGEAYIYIYDEAGTQLYSEYIDSCYDDAVYNFTLEAGYYTMVFEVAEDEYSFEYVFKLTAEVPITEARNLKLNKSSLTLKKGDTFTLKASWSNDDANGKESWKSSKTSVATVNKSGKVTAKAVGTAKITFTKGSKSVTCKVTVKAVKPNKVKLNKTKITLYIGESYVETYKLKATVLPSNASNKKVKWSTSNKKVATVNSSGKVVAKKPGKAVIKVKTATGNKTAKCTVTVKKATVAYNLKEVKNYIKNNGSLNSDGDRFIKMSYDDATFGIVYDYSANNLRFICSYKDVSVATMILKMSGNKNANVNVTYVNDYYYEGFEATAKLNVATYKKDQTPSITVNNVVNVSSADAKSYTKTQVDLGMLGWDWLLDDKVGVELRDLGFKKYKA